MFSVRIEFGNNIAGRIVDGNEFGANHLFNEVSVFIRAVTGADFFHHATAVSHQMEGERGTFGVGGSGDGGYGCIGNLNVRHIHFHADRRSTNVAGGIGNIKSHCARIRSVVRTNESREANRLFIIIQDTIAIGIHIGIQIPVSIHNFAVAIKGAFGREFQRGENSDFYSSVPIGIGAIGIDERVGLGTIGTHLRIEQHVVRKSAPCTIRIEASIHRIVGSIFNFNICRWTGGIHEAIHNKFFFFIKHDFTSFRRDHRSVGS